MKNLMEYLGIYHLLKWPTYYGIVLIKVSTIICPTLQQNQGAACYTTMTCLEIMLP